MQQPFIHAFRSFPSQFRPTLAMNCTKNSTTIGKYPQHCKAAIIDADLTRDLRRSSPGEMTDGCSRSPSETDPARMPDVSNAHATSDATHHLADSLIHRRKCRRRRIGYQKFAHHGTGRPAAWRACRARSRPQHGISCRRRGEGEGEGAGGRGQVPRGEGEQCLYISRDHADGST